MSVSSNEESNQITQEEEECDEDQPNFTCSDAWSSSPNEQLIYEIISNLDDRRGVLYDDFESSAHKDIIKSLIAITSKYKIELIETDNNKKRKTT